MSKRRRSRDPLILELAESSWQIIEGWLMNFDACSVKRADLKAIYAWSMCCKAVNMSMRERYCISYPLLQRASNLCVLPDFIVYRREDEYPDMSQVKCEHLLNYVSQIRASPVRELCPVNDHRNEQVYIARVCRRTIVGTFAWTYYLLGWELESMYRSRTPRGFRYRIATRRVCIYPGLNYYEYDPLELIGFSSNIFVGISQDGNCLYIDYVNVHTKTIHLTEEPE